MPAARGVKRTASKASGSAPPKIKKKHGVQLEVPAPNKVKGRLLACGMGDVGQLGLGEDVVETSRFKYVSALGERIVDACAGGMHTVALDADGKVWTFGCNDEGALGRQGEEFSLGTVTLPEPAVAVSAGDSHTAALLRNGDVYLWGSFRDSHGTMGLVCEGREGKSCREPIRFAVPEAAAAIASGGDHLLILTVSGAVYSAGCGEQGQLGRLSQRSADRNARQGLSALLVPTQVTLKAAMRRVWAGSHASLALDANAPRVLACGLNNYNQLGVTGTKKKVALYTPLEADAFTTVTNAGEVESWTQVSCGQHHSLVLDNNGTCYAVGRHDYGRLGLGEGSGDAEALTAVPKLQDKKCVSIAAGTSSSYAVTDNGEVYAWGMGSEGQLGTGNEDDQPAPRLIVSAELTAHKPLKVSAGGQHTILFVANTADGTDNVVPAAVASSAEQKVAAVAVAAGAGGSKAPPRRGRHQKQDDEISSTNAEGMDVDEPAAPPAQPAPAGRPEKKLNGENEDQAPMETDEADKAGEEPADKVTETKSEPEKEPDSEPKLEAPKEDTPKEEKPEAKTETKPEDPKPEIPKIETPAEDKTEVQSPIDVKPKAEEAIEANATTEQKPKEVNSEEPKTDSGIESQPENKEVGDVEMAEEKTVNGSPEPDKTEAVVEKSKAIVTEADSKTAAPVASETVAL